MRNSGPESALQIHRRDPRQPSGQPRPDPSFVRPLSARRRPGRPALGIPLGRIITEVRRTGKVMAAARELGCSDAYIHVRFRRAGLSLSEVLEAPSVESLIAGRQFAE